MYQAVDDRTARELETLLASVNDAARVCRTNFLFLLVFGGYIAILVATISDVQFFVEGPIKLPGVNVEVPLLSFFWVAPALFFLIHFNFLVQLVFLVRKAEPYAEKVRSLETPARDRWSELPFPFPMAHQLMPHAADRFHTVLGVLITLFVAVLPLLLLLWVQVGFLKYQDEIVTWWHRLIILADLVLIGVLWAVLSKGWFSAEGRVPWRRSLLAAGAGLIFFSFAVAVVPGKFRNYGDRDYLDGRSLRGGGIEAFTGYVPWPRGWAPRRYLIVPGGLYVREAPAAPLIDKNLGPGAAAWALEDLYQRFAKPYEHLSNRNFRYALMADVKLFGANLAGSDFEGANLHRARLTGAKLSGADLSGATVVRARLEAADLRGARLSFVRSKHAKFAGANVRLAEMAGADFQFADFSKADLVKANLEGVSLEQARLDRADLSGANLRYARLPKSNLRHARLAHADLNGALLNDADLTGADLESADMIGASMKRVKLTGARFDGADLSGANLFEADLAGAFFERTMARGAVFSRARLEGADFWESNLSGANLYEAHLEWASIHNVYLWGTEMRGAKISRASLNGSRFDFADMRDVDFTPMSEDRLRDIRAALKDVPKRAEAFEFNFRKDLGDPAVFLADGRPIQPESTKGAIFDAGHPKFAEFGPPGEDRAHIMARGDVLAAVACDSVFAADSIVRHFAEIITEIKNYDSYAYAYGLSSCVMDRLPTCPSHAQWLSETRRQVEIWAAHAGQGSDEPFATCGSPYYPDGR